MARTKLADETEFIPADLSQFKMLVNDLVGQGTRVGLARVLVSWLVDLPVDTASPSMRARYRRELARLGSPPWKDPERLRNRGSRSYPELTAIEAGGRRRRMQRTAALLEELEAEAA